MGKEHVNKGTFGQGGRIRVPGPVLAFGAVLLLALGAAALASAKGSADRGVGPLAKQWWLFAAAALVIGLVAIARLRERIAATDPDSTARARLNRGTLAVVAVLTAAVPVGLFLLRNQGSGNDLNGCTTQCPRLLSTGKPQSANPVIVPTKAATPPAALKLPLGTILLVLGILLALLIAAALVALYLRLRRLSGSQPEIGGAPPPALAQDEDDEAALGAAVLAGRGALEGEARAAIIACYAAMETSLNEAGVPRLESDSPADLLTRATRRGVVAGPAPRRLAALFREARFSTHAMDAQHVDQARGTLDEITAQLTARQEAAEAAEAQAAAESAGGAAAASSAGSRSGARTGTGAP